jgi:hypothetical protein
MGEVGERRLTTAFDHCGCQPPRRAVAPGADHGRFRPYWSWLDTQSPAITALDSEVSPASTTAAQISANLLTPPAP